MYLCFSILVSDPFSFFFDAQCIYLPSFNVTATLTILQNILIYCTYFYKYLVWY